MTARRGLSFDQMAIGLLFIAFACLGALLPAQNDTFWHLRAGADIWRTGHVPRIDSYSFTAAGSAWPDHEWLSQALMYLGYRVGGMRGVEAGAAAIIVGTAAMVYRLMIGPRMTRFVLMAIGLASSSVVWVLRPQILTLLFLVLLVWMLSRERHRPIPLLFVVWANAHAGVVLGALVLIAGTGAAALRWARVRGGADRRRSIELCAILPLAGLATAATPLGFGIYRFVWTSTARSLAVHISEWAPPLPTSNLPDGIFWLLTLALVALLVSKRRALAGAAWSDWAVVAGALALLPPALRSQRNIGPFLILATPAASRLLGPAFRIRLRRAARPPSPDHPALNVTVVVAAGAVAVMAVALAWRAVPASLNWRPLSVAAVDGLRACDGPLYNGYDEGGFLIWFAPERRVFVDGRQDPYPLTFLTADYDVEHGTAPYRPLFDRWKIRCAFLSVKSPMITALAADGWRSELRDPRWAVMSAPPRRPAPPSR